MTYHDRMTAEFGRAPHPDRLISQRGNSPDETDEKTAGPRMLVTLLMLVIAACVFLTPVAIHAVTRDDRPAACDALTGPECIAYAQEESE